MRRHLTSACVMPVASLSLQCVPPRSEPISRHPPQKEKGWEAKEGQVENTKIDYRWIIQIHRIQAVPPAAEALLPRCTPARGHSIRAPGPLGSESLIRSSRR